MSNSLTGLTVSSTYGRLVQVVGGLYYDGFGNLLNLGGGTYAIGPQGPQGSQGPQGIQGATGSTGLEFLGSWDDSTLYFPPDVVLYNGTLYLSTHPTGSSGPSSPPYESPDQNSYLWSLLLPPGSTGSQGYTGPQGAFGPTGPQGPTGSDGPQGFQGLTGPQGFQGLTGPQGFQGFQGPTGPQGSQGQNGYSTSLFNYKSKTTVTSGDPGLGYIIWDNSTQSNSSQLNVSHIDSLGNDLDVVYESITVGNLLYIQDQNLSDNYQRWTVTATPSYFSTYWTFPVSIVTATGTGLTNFPDNHDILLGIISPPLVGPQGPQGFQGTQGPTGPQGFQGFQGFQGSTGTQGSQGPTGPQGATGPYVPVFLDTVLVTLTGTTTLTILNSVMIPANTVSSGNVLNINFRLFKSTAVAATTNGLYINTTLTTVGAQTAMSFAVAAATRFLGFKRDITVRGVTGPNNEVLGSTLAQFTDDAGIGTAGPITTLTIDWTQNQYIFTTSTLANAADIISGSFLRVKIDKQLI